LLIISENAIPILRITLIKQDALNREHGHVFLFKRIGWKCNNIFFKL
jgi:hypothetical protein